MVGVASPLDWKERAQSPDGRPWTKRADTPGVYYLLMNGEYVAMPDFIWLRDPSDDAVPVDSHRNGDFLVWYSYQGEAIEIEFMMPLTPNRDGLPCLSEVERIIQGIEHGPPFPSCSLTGLPTGDWKKLSLENLTPAADGIRTSAYVRFREPEEVGYTYDVIGDGTHVLEYTEDGRAIGLKLLDWERGVRIGRNILPFHREVGPLLAANGIPLDDSRLYLSGFSRGLGPKGPLMTTPADNKLNLSIWRDVPPDTRTETVVLDGPSSVQLTLSESGRLVHVTIWVDEKGVDLSAMPERDPVERILRHLGVPIVE